LHQLAATSTLFMALYDWTASQRMRAVRARNTARIPERPMRALQRQTAMWRALRARVIETVDTEATADASSSRVRCGIDTSKQIPMDAFALVVKLGLPARRTQQPPSLISR